MRRVHIMPFGAECREDRSVRFRLWAPAAQRVELYLCESGQRIAMQGCDDGWFEIFTHAAAPGTLYRFLIDGEKQAPDPASRFQSQDVHGPSQVMNAEAFDWQDGNWRGRPWEEAVIYELHVGAFTPAGTFSAVQERLDYLVDLGVTTLELMPLSDFPGRRNWGYDGVLPFAPDSAYGEPEDLKALIQAAHQRGLMVLLDVVYNHFGPEGNYLRVYAPQFFSDRHRTPWGDGINFDGPGSRVVRDFFIHNALYWLTEYHFDGLRLDAVDRIEDESSPHILIELAETVHREIGTERHVHLVLENDRNQAAYLQRDRDGRPRAYTAQWNDDIHHTLHLLLTGEHDGYYADYAQQPLELLGRCLTEGFAYQGEISAYRNGQARGEPTAGLPPTAFVSFLQNHDQVGNRAFGERITALAEPTALRAAMAVLLLAPSPPLLFMGEEFGAETPFLFFCNFEKRLAAAVTSGRRNEFARFVQFSDPAARQRIPDPNAAETFEKSRLNWRSLDVSEHQSWLCFYRELLHLRHKRIVPLLAGRAVRAEYESRRDRSLMARWEFDGARLVLLANLGGEAVADIAVPRLPTLYTSNEQCAAAIQAGALPGWSVIWFLQS